MQKKEKKSLNDKIEDIVSNNTIWVFLGFILVVIILPRFLLEKSFLGYVPNDPKIDPSSIINNLTTPIIGLFSAFLVYIAFRAQIKANEELSKTNKINEIISLENGINLELENLTLTPNKTNTEISLIKGKEAILNFKDNFRIIHISRFPSEEPQIEFSSNFKYYYKYFIENLLSYYRNVLTTLIIIDGIQIDHEYKKMFINRIFYNHTAFLNTINNNEIKNQFNIYKDQYKLKGDSQHYSEVKKFLEQISSINNSIFDINNKYK